MIDPLEGTCYDHLHPAHGFDKDNVLAELTSRDLNIGRQAKTFVCREHTSPIMIQFRCCFSPTQPTPCTLVAIVCDKSFHGTKLPPKHYAR